MKDKLLIEISPKSVLVILFILILIFVAWQIRWVLITIFIAFILMSGFAPLVDWLVKKGVGKLLSVVLTYLLAISILAILLFLVIPPLVLEVRDFIQKLPIYIEGVNNTLNSGSLPLITNENIAELISSRIDTALSKIFTVFLNIFTLFISFVAIAAFTFYLLLERDKLKNNVFHLFPNLPKKRVSALAHKIEVKLGSWVRGEVLLMLIVGLMTYAGLTILGVEFALPLAVLAGVLEILPMIGPTIAAIPAVVIAFVQNPILAIAVIALYVLVQQLENNLIVPKLMEKAVGFSPLIIITSLLIGATLFGVIGALLSVPVAAILQIILEDYIENKGIDLKLYADEPGDKNKVEKNKK